MLKLCRGSSSRKIPGPRLRDEPHAECSESDHGSLRRPRPGAAAIVAIATFVLIGACGYVVLNTSAEAIDQMPHRLVANTDPSLMEKVFEVLQ